MSQLNLSPLVSPAGGMNALAAAAAKPASRDTREIDKAAKDFESVLLNQMLEEMGKTVSSSGLLDSSADEQTQSIYWMELSQELGRQGGLGLWKQIAKQMKNASPPPSPGAHVEGNL